MVNMLTPSDLFAVHLTVLIKYGLSLGRDVVITMDADFTWRVQ